MIRQSHSRAYIWEKTVIQEIHAPHVHEAALFTIAKRWKQPKCPSADDWIKKMCIYTTEYYSVIKKKEMVPFAATWTDLETIILSEERERQKPYDLTYMWNLKYDTNELIFETDS